jgi:tetratricopeptide (TPR) repeat protein
MAPIASGPNCNERPHRSRSQRSSRSEGAKSRRHSHNLDKSPRSRSNPRSRGMREDSNMSIRSDSYIDSFYSSRRSVAAQQESSKSVEIDSSSGKTPSPRSESAWNLDDKKSQDISPRRPLKRASIDSSSTEHEVIFIPPLISNNTAPRQTCKPISTDSSASKQEIYVLPPIPSFSSPHAKKDTSPRHPQKRASLTEHEIYVGPLETSASLQEIYVTPPFAENDNGYESSHNSDYNGCDSSVASELTFQSQRHDLQRSPLTRTSVVFQQRLSARRQRSQKSSMSVPASSSRRKKTGERGEGTSRSLGGHSVRSTISQTSNSAHQDSCTSLMSCQSHLSLSLKVQTLLEMAADVVNCNVLEQATKCYQKAINAAGSEIMNINIQMGNIQGDDSSSSIAMRASFHEELRLIGVIIGMLRTKMAMLYGDDADYERAIDFCKGAVQVHKHQPAIKNATLNLDDVDDMAGLMVLIIERLENAQGCLEGHKLLLDKIDLFSTVSNISDTESVFSSTKEIIFEMVERSAHDDESAISHYADDALELLSVHAAEQDKHDEGIKYLRDALQIHLVALGLKHPRTGKSLLRVAKMYGGKGVDRKNEELVLGYFHQTAAVLQRSNLGQLARVSILNDISVIHMRRGDFDEAIKFLLDALHTFDADENEVNEKSGGRHIATLQVWRNLGECYMHQDKFRSAEGAFLKALDIQRDCRKIQEAAEKLDLRGIGIEQSFVKQTSDTSIADTICRIGMSRAGGGDRNRALEIYREALVVLNRNTVADKDRPDRELLEKRDQLTHTLFCIAEAENANEDCDKALRMYQLSLKLRNSADAECKDKRMVTKIHCLSCFMGIGDVFMKQKEFSKAKKQYKEALSYSLASHVKETHPIVVAIRQKLKAAEQNVEVASTSSPKVARLEKKADAEIERGALDMATETLKELLVIRRASLKRLKENGLDTSEQVYAIACLLQTFGFVFAKNGDDENAERAFKDASRLFRKGQPGSTRAIL